MTTTKIKPLLSGSFTAVTLDAVGRASTADATISTLPAGSLLNTLQAVNEWHNKPTDATVAARALALAHAAGVDLQDS